MRGTLSRDVFRGQGGHERLRNGDRSARDGSLSRAVASADAHDDRHGARQSDQQRLQVGEETGIRFGARLCAAWTPGHAVVVSEACGLPFDEDRAGKTGREDETFHFRWNLSAAG